MSSFSGRSSFNDTHCLRCGQTVYQVDRVGPLKDFSFFHTLCFKCAVCGTKLSLKNYYNNQNSQDDKEVYCQSHVPKITPGQIDGQSVGIRAAMNVPKSQSYVNEQIRAGGRASIDNESMLIKSVLNSSSNNHQHHQQHLHSPQHHHHQQQQSSQHSGSNGHAGGGGSGASPAAEYRYGRYDASALHIQHALKQTELQKGYARLRFTEFLDAAEQKELERKHREEEDRLYQKFAQQREHEDKKFKAEIKEEWEKELVKLTEKFEKDMNKKRSKDDVKQLTVRHQREKDEFEKNMTLRRDKKKEHLTRKLLEHERAATAALVDKQSSEMITLINEKKTEHMMSQMSASSPPSSVDLPPAATPSSAPFSSQTAATLNDADATDIGRMGVGGRGGGSGEVVSRRGGDEGGSDGGGDVLHEYPLRPPPPMPATISKLQIYSDPEVFSDIDRVAIQVAQEDQKTFTDLVRQLVGNCSSDIDKARTIFRWITVKNLNQMNFEESLRTDTPMGLLRGIKYGTESYHVLFKRLCSYSGLHCVVIKGYSKSAGYQPGVQFEDNRFRNSWNAVYVAGAWRFVQCNWGARHLVNAKETPKPGNKSKSDSLRYEYDDHYFLTDASEFIYEFFPLQGEWQLLSDPLTLRQFEQLPFVRSLFFRYGLAFPEQQQQQQQAAESDEDTATSAVMHTDSTGAATIRICMPAHMQSSLIFHYNLKFYDGDTDNYDGVSLKRFVMQSVVGGGVTFRVHAPASGSLLLDIFANAVTPREYLTGEPMKFKSVCKFKIVCRRLQTVMVPLPDCASGEWGPMKANRLFGLVALSHTDALIFCNRHVHVKFRMTRPLTDFMATLHRNGVDERRLAKYVGHSVEGDAVTFQLSLPDEGQYGMDVYTRELQPSDKEGGAGGAVGEKQLLTHCCKYLINSSRNN